MRKLIFLIVVFVITYEVNAQNETVNGQLYAKDFFRLNGSNNQVIHLRPNAGYGSYIYWAENGVAERGILGYNAGSGDLIYKSGAHNLSNGVERFRITSSGNVGIGTDNPSNTQGWNKVLDVAGAQHSKIIATSVNSTYRVGMFAHNSSWHGGGGFLGTESNHNLHLITDYSPKMTILTNGNIGVGTKSPSAKLDVKNGHLYVGDETFSNPGSWGQTINIDDNVHSRILIEERQTGVQTALWSHTGNNSRVGTLSNHDFGIMTKGKEKIMVKTNGNVGIGTKSPDMKLTVKGKIHAEEVKIDLNVPAPDYVFKEDYKLISIEEVAEFIKENSHLPEIPSAKEFKENGVLQAEMDMNLLKKIEELTLYTIQQQKELKEQNNQIKKLQLLVEQLIEVKK